jgi:hypothetical protein
MFIYINLIFASSSHPNEPIDAYQMNDKRNILQMDENYRRNMLINRANRSPPPQYRITRA